MRFWIKNRKRPLFRQRQRQHGDGIIHSCSACLSVKGASMQRHASMQKLLVFLQKLILKLNRLLKSAVVLTFFFIQDINISIKPL
jgi:hypothetical protein